MLQTIDWPFYLLSFLTLLSALGVVVLRNPINSALSLALTMLFIAGLFFHLDAQFIAGVQLIVYAGAVMVLFVMVLMLFDLKQETRAFTKGLASGALKIVSVGFVCGYVLINSYLSVDYVLAEAKREGASWNAEDITKDVAVLLFSKYVFAFEIIGILLLVIAIGAVGLSRVPGGTHAKH